MFKEFQSLTLEEELINEMMLFSLEWLFTIGLERNILQTLRQIMGKGSDLSRQMQPIADTLCNNGVWVCCEPLD